MLGGNHAHRDNARRSGGSAADAQDEIIQACCNALDKAWRLLDFIARYEGRVTPSFLLSKGWIDDEYDPGARSARPCQHNWVKALDNLDVVLAMRCRTKQGCQ